MNKNELAPIVVWIALAIAMIVGAIFVGASNANAHPDHATTHTHEQGE